MANALKFYNSAKTFFKELVLAEPTANRTITFPDASGTVMLESDVYEWAKSATNPTYTKGEVGLAPPGSVIFLARSTAPSGYLKANGAAVSRTTYSELFLAIGTTFGAGNGSTTFNLPDLRGEFIRGWDDGRGADIGRAFAAWQDSANKSHNHGGATDGQSNDHSHYTPGYRTSSGGVNFGGSGGNMGDSSGTYGVNVNHTHGIYSDGASEARPRNIALLACIKY